MKSVILFPAFGRKLSAHRVNAFSGMQADLKDKAKRLIEGFGNESQDLDALFDEPMRGLDIRETPAGMEIEGEFSGFDEKDIDVSLSGNVLTIRAEKKTQEEKKSDRNGRITERSFSTLSERVTLPFQPNPGKLASSFANGILHVSVPKAR